MAAHQAAVELSLMRSLNKPLTSVCDVIEHEKAVFKLILHCKLQPIDGSWDSALVYPDQQTQDALVYIFKQLGVEEGAAPTEQTAEEVEKNEAKEANTVEEFEQVEEETQDEPAGSPKDRPFFGYYGTKDEGFMNLSLTDPAMKFAVCRSRFTGYAVLT